MSTEQLHRDIGRVEGEIKALRRDVDSMNNKLDGLAEFIAQQKGSRKTTIAIASGVATFVGFCAGVAGTWLK